MPLTIITFILVLSVLVFVHELGHFFIARKLGVKAEEFGFGFPPRIWGFYKDANGKWQQVWGAREVTDAPKTIYSVNWFPLGGFVKIKGENGENEIEQDSFASRKIWQRSIILSAGVIMNIILAMVLIVTGFMIGLPQVVDKLDKQAIVRDEKIQIVEVFSGSPAAEADLKIGDTIVSINGTNFKVIGEMQKFVASRNGESLDYKIKRGQEIIDKKIIPQIRPETSSAGIGVAITETGIVRYPWYIAIWQGAKTTVLLVWAIIVAFYQLIKGLIVGQGISADIAGPVGIAALTGEVARMGFIYIMQFVALLSINLAVINFLPFPALDGGRVLFLIIERLKGSPVKREIEGLIHNIGFVLLMVLVLLVTFRDVSRFSDSFKMIWERIF